MVNQALKWQQVQGLLPRGQKFDLFRGGARASKKDMEEKPPRKMAGQIKFGERLGGGRGEGSDESRERGELSAK